MQALPIHIYRRAAPDLSGATFPMITLFRDNWDDYGKKTLFVAHLYTSEEDSVRIGAVKIAVGENDYRPETGITIAELPQRSYSLGQDVGYYRTLGQIKPRLRRQILNTLKDCVALPRRAAPYRTTDVFTVSFLRSGAALHALRRGGYYIGAPTEDVRPPRFTLQMRLPGATGDHILRVDHSSVSELPHRVTLLIGKNGTGKTSALATLAVELSPGKGTFRKDSLGAVAKKSSISPIEGDEDGTIGEVSQVIAVTYNAFDDFPLPAKQNASLGTYRSRLNYKYCGLRNMEGDIDTNQIVTMWGKSIEPIRAKERLEIFDRVISRFLDRDVVDALCDDLEEHKGGRLRSLSAGQRILVSIFADIISTIEEGSIILIDEPETHLHPGLLTGAFHAVQELLEEFDSHAVISTHSPILLQNVPADFVRVFKRVDGKPSVVQPRNETFGEDLGEIFRLDLGLSDPDRDFTDVLRGLFETHGSAQAVEGLFERPLGLPAKAFLLGLEND